MTWVSPEPVCLVLFQLCASLDLGTGGGGCAPSLAAQAPGQDHMAPRAPPATPGLGFLLYARPGTGDMTETKVLRGCVFSPGSQSQQVAGLRFEPRPVGLVIQCSFLLDHVEGEEDVSLGEQHGRGGPWGKDRSQRAWPGKTHNRF